MSDSDVVDQYMFNTILTDFQYVIDLPLFSTSEYNILRINEPILMSISIIAPTGIFIIICKKKQPRSRHLFWLTSQVLHSFVYTCLINKNLAIANKSRVTCAHNTSSASMITP